MKYQAEFFSNDFVKLFDEIMHMNGDTRESISEKLNMSNSHTFSIPPIRELIDRYIRERASISRFLLILQFLLLF